MNYNQITVGIVTLKSDKVIFDCLNSIKKIKNIIIFDNSNDKFLKKKINLIFPKIKIYLSKKNLGYGVANNRIIKSAKTPFVFILSPDVILKKNCEENLLKTVKKLKQEFAIIAPTSKRISYGFFNKKFFPKNNLFSVDYVGGFAMLINKVKVKTVGMFDKNIFLYYEEIDLCKRLGLANQKIYVDKKSKVEHLGAKSSNIGFEFEKCRNWHYMWSRVYFEKKYSFKFLINVKYAYLLFPQFLKIIFYSLLLNKEEVINKTMRLSGTFNALIGRRSWFRPKLITINK